MATTSSLNLFSFFISIPITHWNFYFPQIWNCRKHKCNRWPSEKIGHPVQWSCCKHDQVVFYFLCFGVWGRWKSHYCRNREKGKRVFVFPLQRTFYDLVHLVPLWHCEAKSVFEICFVLSHFVYYSTYGVTNTLL